MKGVVRSVFRLFACMAMVSCASSPPKRQPLPSVDLHSESKRIEENHRVPSEVLARIEHELDLREAKIRLEGFWLESGIQLDPDLAHLTTAQLVRIQQRSGNYGDDNREAALAKPRLPAQEANILSTAAVVDCGWIEPVANGWAMRGPTLFDRGVCPSEPFATLPATARCTAFLVDKNVVATAYHCLETDPDLASTYFVFGFHERADGSVQTDFAADEVLTGTPCRDENGNLKGNAADDWVFICLNGDPPSNRARVKWRMTGKVADRQELYVVGHPSGLPVIYASDGLVVDNKPNDFFITNLDTYHGNSGSPVFNITTHEVEGMLVRGESDFVSAGSCRIARKCPLDLGNCSGEEVLRVTMMTLPP